MNLEELFTRPKTKINESTERQTLMASRIAMCKAVIRGEVDIFEDDDLIESEGESTTPRGNRWD